MTAPALYKRRPYVVEAMYYGGNGAAIAAWVGGIHEYPNTPHLEYVEIPRRDGTSMAVPGDYVVRGIHGEFYPVSPRHFEAGYESLSARK